MGSATSGFGRGLPVCSLVPFLVKKGGFWAVFGGFRHQRAPQVVGRHQHLMGNPQTSPDLIEISAPTAPHTWHHGTSLAPHLGTSYLAPHIQANPTNPGTTDFGTTRHHTFGHLTSLAPHVTCISQSEARDGARWSPSAVPHVPHVPHIWYLGTSHLAPHLGTSHLAPHIWHLSTSLAPHLGTSYLAPHFGTSPRHITFRHHISKPILLILTRYFS